MSVVAFVALSGCRRPAPQVQTLQLTPDCQLIREYFPPSTTKPLFDFPHDPDLGEEHVYIRHPAIPHQEEVGGSPFHKYKRGCRVLEAGGHLFLILRDTVHYRPVRQKPETSYWRMWWFDSSSELYEYVYSYVVRQTSQAPRTEPHEGGATRMYIGDRWFISNRPYLGWDFPYRIQSLDAEHWHLVCEREGSIPSLPPFLVFTLGQDSTHPEPQFHFDVTATRDANQDSN